MSQYKRIKVEPKVCSILARRFKINVCTVKKYLDGIHPVRVVREAECFDELRQYAIDNLKGIIEEDGMDKD